MRYLSCLELILHLVAGTEEVGRCAVGSIRGRPGPLPTPFLHGCLEKVDWLAPSASRGKREVPTIRTPNLHAATPALSIPVPKATRMHVPN